MTTFTTTYSFMDLLKDNNYVPETDTNEKTFLEDIEDSILALGSYIKISAEDYSYMDLLADHGQVPANDNVLWNASNDNDNRAQVAF